MPLIAWLLVGYLAGLFTGFASGFGGLVAGAGVLVAAFIGGRTRIAGLAAMFVAGTLAASAASDERRSCVADAARSPEVTLGLSGDVARGSFSRAKLLCGAPVSLFVARGEARAGSRVVARGEAGAASDGASLIIRAAEVREVAPPPWTAAARSAALKATDRDFGPDAPLVRALVLADMSEMSPQIRDRWAAAGMVHMLSVSGLHVGIIAAVVELLLGVLRAGRRSAPVTAVVIIVIYVAIIGAPAPAVRSAVMLGVRALSRAFQRSVSPWAILAIGAAHPVLDPWVALDLGYQLSVIGVAALICAASLIGRLPLGQETRWPAKIAGAAVTTVVATVASLPLVAWSMGRVSIIAPLSNLVAGPFVAAVQPMLFLGVLLSPLPTLARFVADAAHPLLAAMDAIAGMSAAVPGASVEVWPTTLAAIVSAVMAVAILMACVERHSLRPLIIAASAAVVLAWMPAPRGGGLTELHMIDVGQGDAIALRTRAGRWVLFDAGRIWDGGDAGRRTIVPYIAHRGGRLEAFVLSHPHADHVGGAASVVDALRPATYFDAGFVLPGDAYRSSLLAARREGVKWRRARPGDSLTVDEATIVFLAPDSALAANLPDPNNASTVALIRVGAVRMLMMGDAEKEQEEWLLENARDWLDADVLKVGHHGSATSSIESFLDAVSPRIALVPVGAGNVYGHPSRAVMASLIERGAQVVRTDLSGTVVVETDGRTVRVRER